MAINFNSDIETIKSNFARLRTVEPYSKPIVAADMNALSANHQAEIANIAGLEKMKNQGIQITGASNNASVLSIVSEFNKFFTQGNNTPAKESPSR